MQQLFFNSFLAIMSLVSLIFGLASGGSSLGLSSKDDAPSVSREIAAPTKEAKPTEEVKPIESEKPKENAQPTEDAEPKERVEVYQGQKILLKAKGWLSQCTIGYIDKDAKRAYTAKHCISDSDWNPINGLDIQVYSDPDNPDVKLAQQKVTIGKAYAVEPSHDMAYIELNDNALLHEKANKHTENASTRAVEVNDRLCVYSRNLEQTSCGDVIEVRDDFAKIKGPVIQGGDSGGPAWFENTGEAVGLGVSHFIANDKLLAVGVTLFQTHDLVS